MTSEDDEGARPGTGGAGAESAADEKAVDEQLPAALRRGASRRGRLGVWLILSLPLLAVAALVAFLALSHQPLAAPGWVIAQAESRANAMLAGRVKVALTGGADVFIDEGFVPRLRLKMVQIARPSGLPIAVLPELRMSFWAEPLMRGKIVPRSFRIRGATVALRRLPDGRIDLDLGGAGGMQGLQFANAGEVTAAIEAAFATPALARLEQITADGVRIRLDDARLGKVWQVSDGRFLLNQDPAKIGLTLAFDVGESGALPAQVALSASTSKTGPEAEFGAAVTDVPAADLAMQSPALAVLGLLDAPISGTFRSGIDASGALKRVDATLKIGAGAISPAEGLRAVPFEGGQVHLSYEPTGQKVSFSEASFASKALRFKASGQTFLRDFANGLPRSALIQVALSDVEADPEGIFERPARISEGSVDIRLRFNPFRVDIGQLSLVEGARRITGQGRIEAGPEGWHVAFDAGVGRINQSDLLALWPPALVEPTRRWLADNVATGELRNVRAALRLDPGEEPRMELGYEFRGAEVTILRTLPPVREGRGFATIHDNSHALMVEEGSVDAPQGGRIEVADSVMVVPDIREKPARAEVNLITRAPIPAALSLLDQPPFEFLTKAGKSTDIATGWAEARTNLRFRMLPKLTPEDVDFDVFARMTDVRSDKVVPGRVLTAPVLTLRADRAGMAIAGRGLFDAVPFDARWSQQFGPEHKGVSRVDGYVNVTPDSLESLKISLPNGAVSGSGWGRMALDLTEGAPARYSFESDLRGLTLAIPEIGWSKAGPAKGDLTLAGTLGTPPTVEKIALTAPGLSAEGNLVLNASGFERARFAKLAVGSWFSGGAELIGRGGGRAPDVTVTSGRLDLRSARFGKGVQGGAGGGNRIKAKLDRLTITDTIALTGFDGSFTTRNGFSGAFEGQVNGGAPVSGLVGPSETGRTAVRITGEDAGAALASSGIFGKAVGGALSLTLSPIGQASYDGNVKIANLRVKDAPTLASMLSAASIIGLLEQLNGEGILFSDVEAAFRLTPQGVSVTRGEAAGASMAVTLTGNFYPGTGQIDMEGVVSPFYLINAIGQVFSRPGEGLFGFTYTLKGTAAAPKVVINPLSIFTPGMFREIFRRAPPKMVTE